MWEECVRRRETRCEQSIHKGCFRARCCCATLVSQRQTLVRQATPLNRVENDSGRLAKQVSEGCSLFSDSHSRPVNARSSHHHNSFGVCLSTCGDWQLSCWQSSKCQASSTVEEQRLGSTSRACCLRITLILRSMYFAGQRTNADKLSSVRCT